VKTVLQLSVCKWCLTAAGEVMRFLKQLGGLRLVVVVDVVVGPLRTGVCADSCGLEVSVLE